MRRVLTIFGALTAVAWMASVAVFGTDQILAAAKFADLRPVGVGLIVLAIEMGGAIFLGRRVRRAQDKFASGWTLTAIVAALWLVIFNVYAGVVNTVG